MLILDQLKNEPKIIQLQKRVKDTIEISMERVAAHFIDPEKYPLPADPESIERAMYNLMKDLPARKQRKFIEKHEGNLAAGTAKRKQLYGDLQAVDFKSVQSISEQVKEKQLPAGMFISDTEFNRYKEVIKGFSATKKPAKPKIGIKPAIAPAGPTPGTTLVFTFEDLTCNKTSEVRKDEVSLGGFFIDALGANFSVDPFEVGEFKNGDTVPLGDKGRLFEFALENSSVLDFPQTFIGCFFLLEKDLLRNSRVLRALVLVLRAILYTAAAIAVVFFGLALFTKVAAAAIISFIASIVGIGAIMVLRVIAYFADDFSDFASDELILQAAPNAGDIFERTLNFELFNAAAGTFDLIPGKYTANIRWHVV